MCRLFAADITRLFLPAIDPGLQLIIGFFISAKQLNYRPQEGNAGHQ